MYISKLLVILVICFLKRCYCDDEGERSYTYVYGYLGGVPAVKKCHKPTSDFYISDCYDNITFPAAKITCRCNVNYHKTIDLYCAEAKSGHYNWYRKAKDQFSCTSVGPVLADPVAQNLSKNLDLIYSSELKIANVEYSKSAVTIKGDLCYKPLEPLDVFHSCVDQKYPTNQTTCYCTNTFRKSINLKCSNGTWYMDDVDTQCKESPEQTLVISNSYMTNISLASAVCNEPSIPFNIFHSCEEKEYPAKITKCRCTHNKSIEITLACSDYYGKVWYLLRNNPSADYSAIQFGTLHFCENIFNPLMVHCYKENNNTEILCNCRSNCFTFYAKEQMTLKDVQSICDEKATHVIRERNSLTLKFDSEQNKVEYACEDGYELNGSNELLCNNGLLNGIVPNCSKVCFTYAEKELYKIIIYILSSCWIILSIVTGSIVYCCMSRRLHIQNQPIPDKRIEEPLYEEFDHSAIRNSRNCAPDKELHNDNESVYENIELNSLSSRYPRLPVNKAYRK